MAAPGCRVIPTRVYVAASWREAASARAAMAKLVEHGCVVTRDWTDLAAQYPGDEAPVQEARNHALDDLIGVRTCDVLLLLTHKPSSSGGLWVELGAAIADQKRIVIAGPVRNVFCHLAAERYDTDEEAIAAICYRRRTVAP